MTNQLPKQFISETLAPKLQANPSTLKESGIQSKKICLDIEGDHGGQWTFSFDSAGLVVLQSGLVTDADCTVQAKDKTMGGVLAGEVNIPFAVMTGKLKIKGSIDLAAKFGLSLKKSF